jgi:predicted nucleotidyltransferase component of viral defense system
VASQYDFSELAAKYGFNIREIEKTCRVADVLRDISNVGFLTTRLSLYGGTALNVIYTSRTLHLSVDLGFNYRHTKAQKTGDK